MKELAINSDFWTLILSGGAAFFTAITACKTYDLAKAASQRDDDKVWDDSIVDKCEIYLSRAYDVLASGSNGNSLPNAPSRIDWLTAARMIEEYKSIASDLRLAHNVSRLEAIRDFWITKFINLLSRFEFDVSYFSIEESNGAEVMPIAPVSAGVIFDFLNWPAGANDPLDNVDLPACNISLRYRPAMNAIQRNARRPVTGLVVGAHPPVE